MNKEERDKYLKNIIDETIKTLATNPNELFDYDKLQVKYNNLMKEKINLQQELNQKNKIIEEIKQFCLDEQIPTDYEEYDSYIEFTNSAYDSVYEKFEELEKGSEE